MKGLISLKTNLKQIRYLIWKMFCYLIVNGILTEWYLICLSNYCQWFLDIWKMSLLRKKKHLDGLNELSDAWNSSVRPVWSKYSPGPFDFPTLVDFLCLAPPVSCPELCSARRGRFQPAGNLITPFSKHCTRPRPGMWTTMNLQIWVFIYSQ